MKLKAKLHQQVKQFDFIINYETSSETLMRHINRFE